MSVLHLDALETLRDWTPTPDGEDDWRLTTKLLERGPEVMWRGHDGAHVTASVIIFSHDRQRVLLCLHGKFDVWVQLGGHLEAGDPSLAAAALREATEESGIAGLVVDPVPVDVDIHQVVNCAGRRLDHHDVIFAVYAPPDAAEQVSDESHALGWFTPDALPTPLGGDTDRVVRNAVRRAAVR
ncbi:NUDIX hydrolase [Polymorphospora rubra]|uniref:NUDIX hydrolase n=1 Tax=Polymorphospora rubra TaxID=338584 RepID=A0A810NG80_9ACTN|nr:NUDIX domain-containing protein [Polymorphospora rubra]BCJ70235.1 NUDIX hydrolase [Polymorphospora rubra]